MDKELIEQLNKAFEAFKASNDARLAQIEAKGFASAEVSANTDRANADITRLTGELATVQAALRSIENDAARIAAPAAVLNDGVRNSTRRFLARTRGVAEHNVTTVTDADVAMARAYDAAFTDYLKNGKDGISDESRAAIRAAMQTTDDSKGGYLVSPDRTGRIVQLIYETTPMRQIAEIRTTSKDRIEGDLDLDEVAGGLVGETETRSETATPTFGRYAIVMGEFYANPRLTQKQLDDSDTDVGATIEEKVSDKLSRLENYNFVLGAGLKGPRGFLTYATGTNSKSAYGTIQQVGTGASGAFATRAGEVNGADVFITTVASMKAGLRDPSCQWMMARLTAAAARKLKDGQANYLWNPDFSKSPGGTILGYGVTEGEDMPQIGANSLSIAFANWKKAYTIFDHTVGLRTLRDPYTQKGSVFFYTTRRTGGDVVDFDAIKLIKFG